MTMWRVLARNVEIVERAVRGRRGCEARGIVGLGEAGRSRDSLLAYGGG